MRCEQDKVQVATLQQKLALGTYRMSLFLDTIHGTIDRRILLNYRVAPDALQRALPKPFRPKLYGGAGIAGVCMIRFAGLRPRHVPAWLGLGSENAAHRIAVEWTADGVSFEGVYIPQRNTNSAFNRLLGGRVFPGIFSGARFESSDTPDAVGLRIVRADGEPEVTFRGSVAHQLPASSVFPDLTAAAGFFSLGATGYSATHHPNHFHGMELHSLDWAVTPLDVQEHYSRYFSEHARFPRGSVELDNALLMRGIAHEWRSRPDLYAVGDGGTLSVQDRPRRSA
jgi:hypothetical protein